MIGTVLAVGALIVVLYPLFTGVDALPRRVERPMMEEQGGAEREAVVALREIEFDRATGKLSDSDYGELHARYSDLALTAMRADASAGDDPIEAAVRAHRARLKECGRCGPRPEPDAVYCSTCGCYLPGACGSCGAKVDEAGAAFCASCGRQLAA